MKYLHTMVRVSDVQTSLRFYCDGLGLTMIDTQHNQAGRFTLIYLAAPNDTSAQIELTHNWDPEPARPPSRSFGHIAYAVDNIYATCERLRNHGAVIARPPRDGMMAFVRSPDGISIELLQSGAPLAKIEPWCSMPNIGEW